jgi:hypothetical protein
MNTLLEVNKVVKQYGDYVALNVSLTVLKAVFMDFRSKWCWKNLNPNHKSNYAA